jgi:glycerophosphoryl diester phosphodiesterase
MLRFFKILILFSTISPLMAQENTEKEILVIAHRGFSSVAPENTLSAIKKAAELGVDIVEIDVHLTKDSIPVLLHDKTLNRTTTGKGHVCKYNFSQLESIDAGVKYSKKYKGEKIPSLEQAMQLVNGQCTLLIEIKQHCGKNKGIEQKVADLIKKYDAYKWCIVQSFSTKAIENTRTADPKIEVFKIFVGKMFILPVYYDTCLTLASPKRFKLSDGININYKHVTTSLVNKIHKSGKRIFVWTVNEPQAMKEMIDLKVDGVITNYPNIFTDLLKHKNAY